jgi:hypothetical protein
MQVMQWTLALSVALIACSSIREDPPIPSPTNPPEPSGGGSNDGGSSAGGRGGEGGQGGEGGGAGATPFVIEECACAVALVEKDNFGCRDCADFDRVQVPSDCGALADECEQVPGCAALLGSQFCTGPTCVDLMDALPPDELLAWSNYVACICDATECQSDCTPISEPQDPECSFLP